MASSPPPQGTRSLLPVVTEDTPAGTAADSVQAHVQRIQQLLKAKDDTSRFVGLALLKSVLDNTPEIRQDGETVCRLWESIPTKFLDRLLRTGATASQKDSKEMLDLAVSVVHTFTILLPEEQRRDTRLLGRIPLLTSTLLPSSEETTILILQALVVLVSYAEGAQAFVQLQDISSLIENAPSQPLALEVLSHAFLASVATTQDKKALSLRIEHMVSSLIATYTGTDAVTLLAFLADFLRRLDKDLLPQKPPWLTTLVDYIGGLISSRPTQAARSAYVNLATTLLQAYPVQMPHLLFSGAQMVGEKPASYLLINLLLIDLRTSFPSLLEKLNDPQYQATARRLASDFDVVSCFIGYLMRFVDDDSPESGSGQGFSMPPDLLLKIRKAMSETFSVAMEFLRDRWDASVAGAMGLHPDARVGEAKTSRGERFTISWDSIDDKVNEDPLVLACIRCLAIWLREDDNETLRKEAAGLCDMFAELYKASTTGGSALDFRRPVLVALEGITVSEEGPENLLSHDGWRILIDDLLAVGASSESGDEDFSRGVEIVRILLPIVENERPGSKEAWLDAATAMAAWDTPEDGQSLQAMEFQVAALQLITSVLAGAHPSVRKRYKHTIGAIRGLASRLGAQAGSSNADLHESLQDVTTTLASLGWAQ
ncbi:hypothetical protein RB597_002325 [Gaeumannomyces tritici]